MGLPTAAAYLICAAVIVPALTGLGVPALTGHLFIFYFACLSAITPPVALAAFTAASVSYTHLDVYKRQVLSVTSKFERERNA